MRPATIMAWIFVGFGLMAIGTLLSILQLTEDDKFAVFLTAMGIAYFMIGMVLAIIYDRHMGERMRARRE